MVFVGFGMMLFLSVSNSLIQLAAPDVLRGRVISIRSLMFMGIAPPVGGLLIGLLTDRSGPRTSVLVAGIVCLLTGNAVRICLEGRAARGLIRLAQHFYVFFARHSRKTWSLWVRYILSDQLCGGWEYWLLLAGHK